MLESLLLVIAVTTDSLATSIGFGSAGIKIPIKSTLIISFSGTAALLVSVLFAGALEHIIPESICVWLSFFFLMVLGIYNLAEKSIRNYIGKKKSKDSLALKIYLDETEADSDKSKILSPKEAIMLSVALSADSVITGIGAGLDSVNIISLVIFSFICGIIAIQSGSSIGRKLASKTNISLGWLCGTILIVLAISGIIR